MSYWSDPAEAIVAVTPSDSVDLTVPSRASLRRGRQRSGDDPSGADRHHPFAAGLQPDPRSAGLEHVHHGHGHLRALLIGCDR